jgi:trans-2,3-dihydro-3-hydroxyanthranilate isomerase
MGLHFDIVDVFTDRAYAGNPLAVVHRARTLTPAQMQAIAAELNLSETAGGPPQVGPDVPGDALAATVGLTADDLDAHLPAGIAAAGVPFAFLPVRPDAVARAVPDAAAVVAATAEQTGLVVLAVDTEKRTAHVRMFGPQVGVLEDPATGAAGVALGVFLGARGVLAEGWTTLTVAQGAERGRPSRLEVRVRVADGATVETAVRGEVKMVAKGEFLALPEPG